MRRSRWRLDPQVFATLLCSWEWIWTTLTSNLGPRTIDFGLRTSVRHVHQVRLHGDARAHLLQTFDDHPLARLQAVGDLPQAVVERSQPDGASDHLVVPV